MRLNSLMESKVIKADRGELRSRINKSEAKSILGQYGVRGVMYDGEIYVGDAMVWHHMFIVEALGLKYGQNCVDFVIGTQTQRDEMEWDQNWSKKVDIPSLGVQVEWAVHTNYDKRPVDVISEEFLSKIARSFGETKELVHEAKTIEDMRFNRSDIFTKISKRDIAPMLKSESWRGIYADGQYYFGNAMDWYHYEIISNVGLDYYTVVNNGFELILGNQPMQVEAADWAINGLHTYTFELLDHPYDEEINCILSFRGKYDNKPLVLDFVRKLPKVFGRLKGYNEKAVEIIDEIV